VALVCSDGKAGAVRPLPPPVFWAQNPCFLEVTGRVALQNIENKEVLCKIFQDKELAEHLEDDWRKST
jgi:hypothetical protein